MRVKIVRGSVCTDRDSVKVVGGSVCVFRERGRV